MCVDRFQKMPLNLRYKYFVKNTEKGFTLVELLVAIVIGLLVIAVALGSLMMTRNVSSLVSEKVAMQQQASYALYVIGNQIRSAGSLELELAATSNSLSFLNTPNTVINGTSTSLTVGTSLPNANYTPNSMVDCLGNTVSGNLITSTFTLVGNELRCQGNGGGSPSPQAILSNVSAFQVGYMNAASSNALAVSMGTVPAAAPGVVRGVSVCFEMVGAQPTNTGGQTYTNCQGNVVPMGNNLRMVFSNVFDLRVRQ